MKPTKQKLLSIYSRSLAKYIAKGNAPRVAVQKALIQRIKDTPQKKGK